MTIITKGMGIILKKGGDLLKKSKKFPGPRADKLLNRKVRQRLRPKGDPHPVSGFKKQTTVRGVKGSIDQGDIDVHARIGRTQRYRNLAAQTLKAARNPKKYKSRVMESGGGKWKLDPSDTSNYERKKSSRLRKLRTKGSPFKIGTFNKKDIPQKYRKDIK